MLEFHQTADLNVWSILIVQVIKLVSKKSVEIHALEVVQVLLIVKSYHIGLLVLALQELKVTLTKLDVHQFLLKNLWIHVLPVLVEIMQFARDIKEKEQPLVAVFQDILVIHSSPVDQNVLKIQTVQEIEYAEIKSVSIPAQDFVVSMLFAQYQIISQDVIVYKVTLAIPLWLVIQYPLSQLLKKWNPVTQIDVVYTVTSAMLEVLVFAIVYQVILEIHQIVDQSVLSTQNVNKV
jgi:hypothetical protein